MKVILRNLLLLTVLWTLVQCEDEDLESRDFPRLNTLEVSEITPEGAKFSAEITVRGGYDLVRFGFVWGEEENPEIESNDRVIYSVNIRSNTFSEKIETTLKDRTTYFVRAFVETEDYLVYGANVSFVSMGSKAPHINTFSPLVGTIGDTVTLSGINFSYVAEQNIVQFDSLDATVTFASDTLLEVIVPLALTAEDPEVFVSIFGNRTVAVNRFQLSTPQIDLFSPQEATDNDELIIAGSGFAHFSELNQVEIGDKEAAVVSASKKQLVVAVPSGIATRESNLKVTVAGQSTIADTPFSLRAPNVTDFQPKQASIRQLVTIEGEHFSTVIDGNEVYFDTAQARIAEVSATSLVVEVPYGVPVNAIIKVITAGQEASASGRFQIQQPVIDVINPLRASSGKIVSLTGDNFSPRDEDNEVFFNGISATILSSSKTRLSVSVPTGINQRSVEIVANTGGHESAPVPFEHVDGQWTQRSTFPGGERPGAIMERIDNSIYFGLGVDFRTPVKEFWKYNIILGGWTRLEDFPGEARMDASSFVINGKLYVGMGRGASRQDEELADFWEFDPASETWQRLPDFPGEPRFNAVTFSNPESGFVGLGERFGVFSNGESDLVRFGDIYEFDPVARLWNEIATYPGGARGDAAAFVIDQKAYVGMGALASSESSNHRYDRAFWSYDFTDKTWSQIADFPVDGKEFSVAFAINNRGYVGFGFTVTNNQVKYFDEFFEYDPVGDEWTETARNSFGSGQGAAVATVDGAAYLMAIARSNQRATRRFEIFTPFQ